MVTRASAHADDEKAIFDAFCAAYPSFAAQVCKVEQPDVQFPDVTVTMTSGAVVDFELGEWLDGPQIAMAKRYDALAEAITDAVGPQAQNPSPNFRALMLTPREEIPRFAPADREEFAVQLRALIDDTDQRWPSERFWHSPQGRLFREFDGFPTLGKYLRSIHFDPLVAAGKTRPWAQNQPWIFVERRGGSYSPDTAVRALDRIIEQKIGHYGKFARPTRLIIYYGKAVAYNTPYIGIDIQDFADVAAIAAQVVQRQTAFEKIYLLNALEPALEAFEVYPTYVRCA